MTYDPIDPVALSRRMEELRAEVWRLLIDESPPPARAEIEALYAAPLAEHYNRGVDRTLKTSDIALYLHWTWDRPTQGHGRLMLNAALEIARAHAAKDPAWVARVEIAQAAADRHRNTWVESVLRWAYKRLGKRRRNPDQVQEALIGLTIAVERYDYTLALDAEHGARSFWVFAWRYIDGYARRWANADRPAPYPTRRYVPRAEGVEPEPELELDLRQIDELVSSDDIDEVYLDETIAAPDTVDHTEHELLHAVLAAAEQSPSPRQRVTSADIAWLRALYGLGDAPRSSLREIGEGAGLSAERVRQRTGRALDLIRSRWPRERAPLEAEAA